MMERTRPLAPLSVEAPLALLISGPGRRHVDLAMRFPLQRRGGWQIAEGRLPSLPAAAITLASRQSGNGSHSFRRRRSTAISKPNATTKRSKRRSTADGAFRVQWRAKAGVGAG